MVTKCSVFWNITLYSALKVNQRFGRTCRLSLQEDDEDHVTQTCTSVSGYHSAVTHWILMQNASSKGCSENDTNFYVLYACYVNLDGFEDNLIKTMPCVRFDSDGGGSSLLRNVSEVPDYPASLPRR
jgi:hypothetical protein